MSAMIILFVAFVAILGFYKYRQISAAMAQGKAFVMPPTAITTIKAAAITWQPVLSTVGSLKAINDVDVSTDLAGIVTEIAFESGKPVKKGEVLVRLDTQQEEAQLKSSVAAGDLARVNLTRQRELLSKRATSQSEFDTAAANADQAAASVEQARVLISRKTIRAPFDGVLGIRKVNIGQYLDVGKPIASLQSLHPIYVEFSVPQQEIPQVGVGKKIRITAAGIAGKTFEGEVTAVNSKVDEATRNIAVEATVSNEEALLRGGMFVNVEVLLPEQEGVIVIPASSIVYAPYGDSVFIVKEVPASPEHPDQPATLQAVQQFVTLGPSRGDQVAVVTGLKHGDVVVSAGAFKLTSGASVVVNNSVLPGNEVNPTPPET